MVKATHKLSATQISYLNLLRYFLCLAIFSGHFVNIFVYRIINFEELIHHNPLLFLALRIPTFSVMLFFVLSGFLITYTTIIDINKNGYFSIKQYIKKRIIRIFPPLWFAIFITWFIYKIIIFFNLFGIETYILPHESYSTIPKAFIPFHEIITNIILIPGITGGFNAPLWSLSYEMFYYIIFANLMIFLVRKQFMLGTLLTVYISAFILNLIYLDHSYLQAIDLVLKLFIVWFLGSLLAIIFLKGKLQKIPSSIFLGLMVLVLNIFIYKLSFFLGNLINERLIYAIIAFFIMSYILTANLKINATIEFISKASKFSYTLYLIHFPLLLLMLSAIGPQLQKFNTLRLIALYFTAFTSINFLSFIVAIISENKSLPKHLISSILKYLPVIKLAPRLKKI